MCHTKLNHSKCVNTGPSLEITKNEKLFIFSSKNFFLFCSKNKVVPDPRDEGKETVFTISGGGDGGVKDQDQDQDQDVASVSKTDNKSIGGGNVLSLQRKIQYFIKSTIGFIEIIVKPKSKSKSKSKVVIQRLGHRLML